MAHVELRGVVDLSNERYELYLLEELRLVDRYSECSPNSSSKGLRLGTSQPWSRILHAKSNSMSSIGIRQTGDSPP